MNAQLSWFCWSPEGNKGPFTREQMTGMLAQGVLNAESAIWREGYPDWKRLAESGDFTPDEVAGATAQAATAESTAIVPAGDDQDEFLDSVAVDLVEDRWRRHRRKQLASEVDEVLVGAVITATLDTGYQLIDLHSTGTQHYLRFEQMESGDRIIFELRHLAESLITSKVIGHEAQVTVGYGERFHNFGTVWKALRQEFKGGYIRSADPGIITVDGDAKSHYVYVEIGMVWDINDYLAPDDPYQVNYPKLTQHIGATVHALRKYLRGRFRN